MPRSVFQRLYDSEINFSVSCFWDGGFSVALGDEANGYPAVGIRRTWAEVEAYLEERACEHFPDTPFVQQCADEYFATKKEENVNA